VFSDLPKGKRWHLSTLFLFGSRGSGNISPLSDTDIGVLMKIRPPEAEIAGLSHRLYDLFSDLFPGSRVDIVALQTAPLPIQYAAVSEGKILFEEDPVLTADYTHSEFRFCRNEASRQICVVMPSFPLSNGKA
jgi:predicted nucleotidyltransferase